MKLKVAIGIVVTLLLVGAIGLLSYGFFFASAEDDALSLVPQDSIGYFNVFLSPSNGQKQALQDLIEKTPFESPDAALDELQSVFDEGLQDTGCTFKEDIDPWLGKQIAGFLTETGDGSDEVNEAQGGVLVATDDEDSALASLEKCGDEEYQDAEDRSYEGVDYKFQENTAIGVVEGYLVIATEPALKEVVDTAAGEESLEGSEKFQDAIEPLAGDRIATFYLDLKAVLEQVGASGTTSAAQASLLQSFYGGGDQALAAGLFLRSDAIVFEYAAGLPQGGEAAPLVDAAARMLESDVLSDLPGGSWGALGIGSFGDYVDTSIDTFAELAPGGREFVEQQFQQATGLSLSEDVLAWMGDLGIFVQGTSPTTISGGVVIETTDREASLFAVEALERWAKKEDAPIKELAMPGAEGFSIQDPFQAQPINVAVGDDRVVIAYGNVATEQALEGGVTLAEDETFRAASEAIGDEFTMSGYFEADSIQTLVEDTVLPSLTTFDPETFEETPNVEAQRTYEESVKPFIDPLSFMAFGTRIEDDTSISRLIIGVE
jgi:hypothetical protein